VSESFFKNNENTIQEFKTKNPKFKRKFESIPSKLFLNAESKDIHNCIENRISSPGEISVGANIEELEFECINCDQFYKFNKMELKNHILLCSQNITNALESSRLLSQLFISILRNYFKI
jgi:hypothetical protein